MVRDFWYDLDGGGRFPIRFGAFDTALRSILDEAVASVTPLPIFSALWPKGGGICFWALVALAVSERGGSWTVDLDPRY